MPRLEKVQTFCIVKAAGENGRGSHMFLVNGRTYVRRAEAVNEARRLAMLTPGNRYYIFAKEAGFMIPEAPKMESFDASAPF